MQNQNDYIIAFDENGSPYIAHAGFMERARGAVNAAANRVQQVANQAKGVGRGIRQNHKYILKVNENGKTRYFYKQEEVKAYYEAKKRGIKNAAEYAQNAVKNKASEVTDKAKQGVSTAKNAVREATGIAARDRMDAADSKYAALNQAQNEKYASYKKAQDERKYADYKTLGATIDQKIAEDKAQNANFFNRKRRETEAEIARNQQQQYQAISNQKKAAEDKAKKELDTAIDAYNKNADDYYDNKRIYDKSLAGTVDRTAAQVRETASNVRDATSNAGRTIKQVAEDVSGVTAKRNAEASAAAASQAKRDSAQADRVLSENRRAYAADKSRENLKRLQDSEKGAAKDFERAANASLSSAIDKRTYRNTPLGRAESEAKAAKELGSAAYNKAKDSANNTVTNAKNRFERMKSEFRDKTGQTLKERAETAEKEAKEAERERQKAAGRYSDDVNAALRSEKNLNANPNSAHAQAERDRTVNELRKSSEDYYKDGGALDTAQKKRDEAINAREEYADFKKNNSAQAMIDKARTAVKDKTEDLSAKAKSTAQAAKESAQNMIDQARTAVKDKAEDLSAKAKSTAQAAKESAQGMIENARSSTAKAVNEAWDKIPKNADGTVNPFDSNFQSAYNDWKSKKDKYDGSLTGQAKAAAEKATDSVKDMIDQAKRTARDAAASAQSTIDNATGNNYRKRAQEANQAAENAINQRARTSDQLENQRDKYGSKENDSEHIYGDSEGYYYKTKEQRDRAESLISKRDQYDADIVDNNRASKVNDSMYADSKAGKINSLLGRNNASTSERANSKASEVQNKWARQEAESKLIGGRLDPGINVSKEYVYSRASNSGMAGQVRQVMQLEEAMRDAESAYDRLGNNSSKPQSSSRVARQKMLQAQDAYEKAYKDLIDDINKQYDKDLAAYEKQYGKYNR